MIEQTKHSNQIAGMKLASVRTSLRIGQKELAREMGVTNTEMRYLEGGVSVWTPEVIQKHQAAVERILARRKTA